MLADPAKSETSVQAPLLLIHSVISRWWYSKESNTDSPNQIKQIQQQWQQQQWLHWQKQPEKYELIFFRKEKEKNIFEEEKNLTFCLGYFGIGATIHTPHEA